MMVLWRKNCTSITTRDNFIVENITKAEPPQSNEFYTALSRRRGTEEANKKD